MRKEPAREGAAEAPAGTRPLAALVAEVKAHCLFDTEWYRATCPEAALGSVDPVEHYLSVGAARGFDPNPFFDTEWYLARYPEVSASGLNPLIHFIRHGAGDPLDPGPGFSTAWYVTENPEVAEAGLIPLEHYLAAGRLEDRAPRPQHAGQALESYQRAVRASLLSPAMQAKVRAALPTAAYPLDPRPPVSGETLPMPPLDLAVRIGSLSLESFEEIGRGTRRTIARCLPAGFSFRDARTLDFGCGVGRVIRFFEPEARQGEVWGCDIDGTSVRWLVENLSPPFRFFQLSDAPRIPLESDSVDLAYAIAVFSQLNEGWQHWALELRRVLKPGGVLVFTFAAQTPFEEMLGLPYRSGIPALGMYVKNPLNSWNRGGPMVFLSPEWVKTRWGSLFDIDFIALDGLLDYQSICVARKPGGAPSGADPPVLSLGTTQAFNPDATGKIFGEFDEARPFRDSYGIEASSAVTARGWIAFRDDAAATMTVSVDGETLPAGVAFEAGLPYRDWGGAQVGFAASFDASGIEPGEHRLRLDLVSRRGIRHALSIPLVIRPDRRPGP